MLQDQYEYVGAVKAARKVKVSSEIGGIVERLFFEKGDRVSKGQVLAEIGTSKVKLEVHHAEASLKAAESMLEKARKGSRPEEIAVAEAALREAEAALREAEDHFARIKELHLKSSVSRSEYDKAERLYESAQARRGAAEKQLELIRKGPRDEDRRLAEAQAEQARAALALAMDRLSRSVIRSPIEGIVSHKAVEEGEVIIVPPGAPVAQIVDLSSLKVEISVSEMDLALIKKGDRLPFTVDALPGRTYWGDVAFLSPSGEEAVRSYRVELIVGRPEEALADGMTARVRVQRLFRGPSVLIRPSAVAEKEGVLGVYVVEGDLAKFREIRIGGYRGDRLEVSSGLEEGDILVLNPSLVKEGMAVEF